MISRFFSFHKENAHIIIRLFGIKFTFQYPLVNQLEDACCIPNLDVIKKQNTYFPHPVGIVISKFATVGKNCTIYQNVTIGKGKFSEKNNTDVPVIGDNVVIYANSVIIGGVKIGNNAVIGAGSVVLRDVDENEVVAGNPARFIKKNTVCI